MSLLRVEGLDPQTHRAAIGADRGLSHMAGVSTLDVQIVPEDASDRDQLRVTGYCHNIRPGGESVHPISMGPYVLDVPYPAWVGEAVRRELGALSALFGVPAVTAG